MILIQGKARKSIYMEILYKTSEDALFVVYGVDFPLHLSDNVNVLEYKRSKKTRTDVFELEMELNELMAHIFDQTNYRNIFLYGNFSPSEVEALKKVSNKVAKFISLVVSINDDSIQDRRIIIDEFVW